MYGVFGCFSTPGCFQPFFVVARRRRCGAREAGDWRAEHRGSEHRLCVSCAARARGRIEPPRTAALQRREHRAAASLRANLQAPHQASAAAPEAAGASSSDVERGTQAPVGVCDANWNCNRQRWWRTGCWRQTCAARRRERGQLLHACTAAAYFGDDSVPCRDVAGGKPWSSRTAVL